MGWKIPVNTFTGQRILMRRPCWSVCNCVLHVHVKQYDMHMWSSTTCACRAVKHVHVKQRCIPEKPYVTLRDKVLSIPGKAEAVMTNAVIIRWNTGLCGFSQNGRRLLLPSLCLLWKWVLTCIAIISIACHISPCGKYSGVANICQSFHCMRHSFSDLVLILLYSGISFLYLLPV